jgi:arsenate reductase
VTTRQRTLRPRPGVDAGVDQVAGRLAALADPVRLRLLSLLARGECPVGVLADALGVAQPLVSFHLKVLRQAGIVSAERAGLLTYHRLQPATVKGLLDEVTGLLALAQPELDLSAGERAAVHRALARLAGPYTRLLGAGRVERIVREEVLRLRGVRTRRFLELLVERHARERLRALAQAEGRLAKAVPEVLFVCVRNAGRSQLAAALAEQAGAGRIHAWSAGSQPGDAIQPEVAAALAEVGVDVAACAPKPWTTELVRAADVVVTMGCGDACPYVPGVRYLEWDVPDPAGRPLGEVRALRDALRGRVDDLIARLTTPATTVPASQ